MFTLCSVCQVIDHVMAGVEEVTGQHGSNFMRVNLTQQININMLSTRTVQEGSLYSVVDFYHKTAIPITIVVYLATHFSSKAEGFIANCLNFN